MGLSGGIIRGSLVPEWPHLTTDQGVQHACESLGGKPVGVMKVKAVPLARCGESPPRGGRIVDRSQVTLWRDMSESVPVATRKMVNYA